MFVMLYKAVLLYNSDKGSGPKIKKTILTVNL